LEAINRAFTSLEVEELLPPSISPSQRFTHLCEQHTCGQQRSGMAHAGTATGQSSEYAGADGCLFVQEVACVDVEGVGAVGWSEVINHFTPLFSELTPRISEVTKESISYGR